MKRARVLGILLVALGIALPAVSMIPTPSRMECPKGYCGDSSGCPDGMDCIIDPGASCGTCQF